MRTVRRTGTVMARGVRSRRTNRWMGKNIMRLALRISVTVVVGLAMGSACSRSDAPEGAGDGRIVVYAGIPPVAGVLEKVAGASADVRCLLSAGQSPHAYEPTPRQIAEVCSARMLVTIGLPFEEQVLRKLRQSAGGFKVIDAGAGAELRRLSEREGGPCDAVHDHAVHDQADHDHAEHDHAGHSHAEDEQGDHEPGHEGKGHAPGEIDPHVWMSPRVAMLMARNICQGLSEIDPGNAEEYEGNCAQYTRELEALDAELAEKLAPFRGQGIYVFHPAYGYFADAYGLRQIAIQAGGKAPVARELAALVEQARADRARLVIVQPQYDKRNAETIAREIGAQVAVIDPLAKDITQTLRELAGAVQTSGVASVPGDATDTGAERDSVNAGTSG